MVAKIEWHKGELFPRVGFIVTNLRRSAHRVVKFYNGRGTAEQWIKEGKNAVKWTRLSCHDFVDNQVRLQLFALAYNLGNWAALSASFDIHLAQTRTHNSVNEITDITEYEDDPWIDPTYDARGNMTTVPIAKSPPIWTLRAG